jgi:hypothetical protein
MLYEVDRHEKLSSAPWDETRVLEGIQEIVQAAIDSFDDTGLWPKHPRDEDLGPAEHHRSLYCGAAGTLWALWYLSNVGATPISIDTELLIENVYQDYRAHPDFGPGVASFSLGEAGILLVRYRMSGSADAARRLYEIVDENIPNPTNEPLWGAPGTMLAAWYMWEWTAEVRWRELFLKNVEHLWQGWQLYEPTNCHLWTQEYGATVQYLGAGHGFSGNVYPLLRGASLLDEGRRQTLYERVGKTLANTASVEGEHANWPPRAELCATQDKLFRLQWCHGSPGIITGLRHLPTGLLPDAERLLLLGGELTWQAGPLTKGPGLCHGTAGNGYALLSLYRRSGDERWLARARAFAMHALQQSSNLRAEYGCGRHTLWTGDLGLAVYLWHCISGEDLIPGLDII